MDKVDRICSELVYGLEAGPVEVTLVGSSLAIFDPTGTEKVNLVLGAVSAGTSELYPCPPG